MVHFSIDGEWLADMARTRLMEGAYQSALNILGSLEGMTLEQQISILKGEMTLQGENNLKLIAAPKEVQEEMQTWHQEYYGRFFEHKNRLYEPYAIVGAWNRDDLPTSESRFSRISYEMIDLFDSERASKMTNMGLNRGFREHLHARSLYYADEPERDWAVTVTKKEVPSGQWTGEVSVLFREVSEQAPFWAKEYYGKTPYEAIETSIKSWRRLESRGADMYDLSDDITQDFLHVPEATPLEESDSFDIHSPEYNAARTQFIETYRQKQEQEQWDKFDREQEAYRQRVIEFANTDKEYGWKEFIDETQEPPKTLKVPYRAFLHFAVSRAQYSDRESQANLPPYEPIFPSGWKMRNDDPLHTDVWFGAGLNPDLAYDHESWEHQFFFKKVFETQSAFLNDWAFNIINSAKLNGFEGTTVNIHNYEEVPKGQRLLVLPHLGVEFETAALQCDAIITETGGKLAHLAIVGREFGIPIVRVEDAALKFALTKNYHFDFESGQFNEIKTPTSKLKLK